MAERSGVISARRLLGEGRERCDHESGFPPHCPGLLNEVRRCEPPVRCRCRQRWFANHVQPRCARDQMETQRERAFDLVAGSRDRARPRFRTGGSRVQQRLRGPTRTAVGCRVQNGYMRDGTRGLRAVTSARTEPRFPGISSPPVTARGRAVLTRRCLVMNWSPVRVRASAVQDLRPLPMFGSQLAETNAAPSHSSEPRALDDRQGEEQVEIRAVLRARSFLPARRNLESPASRSNSVTVSPQPVIARQSDAQTALSRNSMRTRCSAHRCRHRVMRLRPRPCLCNLTARGDQRRRTHISVRTNPALQ